MILMLRPSPRFGRYVSDNMFLVTHKFTCSTDQEVESYYEGGLRVPDYVTLLWADDKYGSRLSYIVNI